MPRAVFPRMFSLDGWAGPRVAAHARRQDAFQQLVADLLQVEYGAAVNVFPTGGADGSIDAFADIEVVAHGALAGLTGPVIAEMKDHDDTSAGVTANVRRGWVEVAARLETKALSGWPNLYGPWRRARSYVYFVSAVLTTQQMRDDLETRISSFFARLRARGLCLIDEIRVVDWTDLRPSLDGHASLRDGWLGTGLPMITEHAQFVAGFSALRRYLSQDRLPFSPPPLSDPSHPESVLSAVRARKGEGGVLLVGPGGAGKTRTSVEVANLAVSQGTRVLHVAAGEPPVTVEDIAAAVLTGERPTLLVLDYLNEMLALDLGSLRRNLLSEASRRGIHLMLLASVRPGAVMHEHVDRDQLFDAVIVRPRSQHRRDITIAIVHSAATQAVERLGEPEVIRLVGERPIIALLIAAELERRVVAGTEDPELLAGIRTGDLLRWLQRRLAEDGLARKRPANVLELPAVEPTAVASAAVLASAPQDRSALVAAALASLGPGADQQAQFIVDTLGKLGWLEAYGTQLSAAHDVVADEMMERVVLLSDNVVDEPALEHLMAAAMSSARTLGRFALSLGRLVGSDPESPRAGVIRIAAGRWLARHSTALGALAAASDPDISSYALGSVVDGEPWSTVAAQRWNDLIAPWLSVHASHPAARHLLYKGLSDPTTGDHPALTRAAFQWLRSHDQSKVASFVLRPLIRNDELGAGLPAATTHALTWLDRHHLTPEAQFVLNALLGRNDLQPGHAHAATTHALTWLKTHHLTPDAQFVLNALLGRNDLQPGHAHSATTHALTWLKTHHLTPDARFVIGPLVGRDDLQPDPATTAICHAIDWLNSHHLTPEASYVLRPLLGRDDLQSDQAHTAICYAIDWISIYPLDPYTDYVLSRLMARAELTRPQLDQLAEAAVDLLEVFPEGEQVSFQLRNLLNLSALPQSLAARVAQVAVEQLEREVNSPEGSYLLRWCMRSPHLGNDVRIRVRRLALRWLERFHLLPQADFILKRLLRSVDTPSGDWLQIADLAFAWLRIHTTGRDFVLVSLLTRQEALSDDRRRELLAGLVGWIEQSGVSAQMHIFQKQAMLEMARDLDLGDEIDRLLRALTAADPWQQMLLEAHETTEGTAASHGAVVGWIQTFSRRARTHPDSAAYAIVPLLVAASYLPHDLGERIESAVAEFVAARLMRPEALLAVMHRCADALEADEFANTLEARSTLTRIGLRS